MKLTTGILLFGMTAGAAWGQNPDVIENTRNTVNNVERKKAMDENAALATAPAAQPSSPAVNPSNAPAANGSQAPHKAAKPAGSTAKARIVIPRKASQAKERVAVADQEKPAAGKKEEAKKINLTGRRDPFVSPVVNRSMLGSGCSTGGKRCLAIDQVNLKGVVKSDTGMIAVVVNALDKAYFLHENDPVFNGYVVKITGDSIIFKETFQDKLGKSFTREVTKKITTPAV
jgi:Tfp pilus assembly protein PilP